MTHVMDGYTIVGTSENMRLSAMTIISRANGILSLLAKGSIMFGLVGRQAMVRQSGSTVSEFIVTNSECWLMWLIRRLNSGAVKTVVKGSRSESTFVALCARLRVRRKQLTVKSWNGKMAVQNIMYRVMTH